MASALPGARMVTPTPPQQLRPSLLRASASSASSSAPAAWLDASPLAQKHGPVKNERRLGGSQWASQLVLETRDGARFFAKTAAAGAGGDAAAAEMFRGEMLGLNALRDASDAAGSGLVVPRVFFGGAAPPSFDGGGGAGGGAIIVMEHLDLGGNTDGGRSLQARLGEALARVHNVPVPPPPAGPAAATGPASAAAAASSAAPQFGFPVDNTIGGTPQRNGWSASWVDFYRDRRLAPMLRLAADPALSAAARPVLDQLPLLFCDYGPGGALEGQLAPSVLHGDLWSGNYGAAAATGHAGGGQGDSGSGNGSSGGGSAPAVFDPATYYGHSEAEFGMSWCAGFSADFWAAYFAVRPRAPGFDARRPLYELYHYLNHLILFGSGYRGECARCLERLAAVVKSGGVPLR